MASVQASRKSGVGAKKAFATKAKTVRSPHTKRSKTAGGDASKLSARAADARLLPPPDWRAEQGRSVRTVRHLLFLLLGVDPSAAFAKRIHERGSRHPLAAQFERLLHITLTQAVLGNPALQPLGNESVTRKRKDFQVLFLSGARFVNLLRGSANPYAGVVAAPPPGLLELDLELPYADRGADSGTAQVSPIGSTAGTGKPFADHETGPAHSAGEPAWQDQDEPDRDWEELEAEVPATAVQFRFELTLGIVLRLVESWGSKGAIPPNFMASSGKPRLNFDALAKKVSSEAAKLARSGDQKVVQFFKPKTVTARLDDAYTAAGSARALLDLRAKRKKPTTT